MKVDYCREKISFFIETHPYHKSINEKLIEESKNFFFTRDLKNVDGSETNVRALQTFNNIESPTLSLIDNWILSMWQGKYGFKYSIVVKWISQYNKGDYTLPHQHCPASYAFNYFIKTPPGSSPLVFTYSGKRVKAEEGKIVIFPGNLEHQVPKNRCDGRITLAGNIMPILE
tara:strand:+ start:314 stop:829 length:516 start_codon:yes stop_codon:yes gene_type:complete